MVENDFQTLSRLTKELKEACKRYEKEVGKIVRNKRIPTDKKYGELLQHAWNARDKYVSHVRWMRKMGAKRDFY